MSENITAPTITPTIRERVERGAAWLDSVKPEWRSVINLDTFDIADVAYCVVGQVFRAEAIAEGHSDGYDYVYEHYVLPGSGPWMTNRGFDASDFTPGAYSDLQTAWQRYLTPGTWA